MGDAKKLVAKTCEAGCKRLVDRRVRRCACGQPFRALPAPRFKVTMELVCDAKTVKKLLSTYPESKITTSPDN